MEVYAYEEKAEVVFMELECPVIPMGSVDRADLELPGSLEILPADQ